MIARIASMPWIQLFLNLDCNLRCSYCPQDDAREQLRINPKKKMNDRQLMAFAENIPATHFYVIGGEPLIYKNVDRLAYDLMELGHLVSFITNLVLPIKVLEKYLHGWNLDLLGYFCVTHHIHQISFEYLLPRILLLKEFNIRFLIKYIAAPDKLEEIISYMDRLREMGVGVSVAPMQGSYQGKHYPAAYSDEIIDRLLNMFTLNSEALNLFEGIHSLGLPCRGGVDLIGMRMYTEEHFVPCCRGHLNRIDFSKTYFGGQPRTLQPCQQAYCSGNALFSFGLNGVSPEIQRFSKILSGESEVLGGHAFWQYLGDLQRRGFSIVNQHSLDYHWQRWGLKPVKAEKRWKDLCRLNLKSIKKSHPDVQAEYKWGKLRLSSLPQKWAYIGKLLLNNAGDLTGPCRFEIDLMVTKGKIGVGVLHSSGTLFLREVYVNISSGFHLVTFELPETREAAALVFRTSAENGERSSALVRKVVLKRLTV